VRVATWNVNSVRRRVPRLLPWLDERRPDVVCLQETKLADDAFGELLGEELASRGYDLALHGEVQWNGVAILSRVGLEEVVLGIPDGPGFPLAEARAVSATCGGIRVHSVYVPNGRAPDSEHVRERWPHERVFTYWDYRAGMFHKDLGMRIDLVLAAPAVADRVRAAWVDRQARKGTGPSDHAPVIVDLDEAPDGDIGPVVPPPSAPDVKPGSVKVPQSQ
jgi:exonuclease III